MFVQFVLKNRVIICVIFFLITCLFTFKMAESLISVKNTQIKESICHQIISGQLVRDLNNFQSCIEKYYS